MTKKKRTGVYVEMSSDEVEAYQKARAGRTHRENLLSSVGIDTAPRRRGRPFRFHKEPKVAGFKFDKRSVRSVKCENCGLTYQSTQKLGGAICTRAGCRYNSKELRKNFRKIVCEVCNLTYYTSRPRGASKCYRCGNIVSEIVAFEWKMPKSTGPRQDATSLVEEEYQGNAAIITLSKRAMLYFSIPEHEWAAMTEEEKLDKIYDLPGVKRKSGGEEINVKDALERQHRGWRLDRMRDNAIEMQRKTRKPPREYKFKKEKKTWY